MFTNTLGSKFHCRKVNGKHVKMGPFPRLCTDLKHALINALVLEHPWNMFEK